MNRQKYSAADASSEIEAEASLISGIDAYCDRWCERCAFTARCAVFRTEQLEKSDSDYDDSEQGLWRRLQSRFEQTLTLLDEIASEEGIDLSALDADESDLADIEEQVGEHPLVTAANQYAMRVERWFEQQPQTAEMGRDPLGALLPPGGDPDDPPQTAGEVVAVIRWYQFQVVTKLVRGVTGREMCRPADVQELTDADGSVKVALIGMDRSLAAWLILQACFPSGSGAIAATITEIKELRLATEQAFPNARHFIRPGFDSVAPYNLH